MNHNDKENGISSGSVDRSNDFDFKSALNGLGSLEQQCNEDNMMVLGELKPHPSFPNVSHARDNLLLSKNSTGHKMSEEEEVAMIWEADEAAVEVEQTHKSKNKNILQFDFGCNKKRPVQLTRPHNRAAGDSSPTSSNSSYSPSKNGGATQRIPAFNFDLGISSKISGMHSESSGTESEDYGGKRPQITFNDVQQWNDEPISKSSQEDDDLQSSGLYIAPCMSLTHIHGATTEILPYLLISTTGDGLLEDEDYLRASDIVFVVNCCEETSSQGRKGTHLLEKNDFTVLYLNLKDESAQSLTNAFEQFFPIVEKAKSQQKKCLILCHSGMSRSVSLVLAYLLACEQMSLIDAFTHVKERRRLASPNPGFMAQLVQLEQSMRETVTLDLERYKNDRFADPISFAVQFHQSGEEEDDHDEPRENGSISPPSDSIDGQDLSSHSRNSFKGPPKTPRGRRSHKRVESDISITFNFSVDEGGGAVKKDKASRNRMQSDISIKFFDDGSTSVQTNSKNTKSGSDVSFVMQHSSGKPSSLASESSVGASGMGAQVATLSSKVASSGSISSSSKGNSHSTSLANFEEKSVSSVSFARTRRLSTIQQGTEAQDRVLVNKKNSTYFPLFQEVSSYVSSLLVCQATMDTADVTIKSPCVARRIKGEMPQHFGDISVPYMSVSKVDESSETSNLPIPAEANVYESLVTVCTSLSAMDGEESDEESPTDHDDTNAFE
jgi:hypothetical protein